MSNETFNANTRLLTPSIEAVNLTKRFGTLTAVENLSLRIEGPKCVGFLGPNGSGKTTTLKMFTGLMRASSGQAKINGVDVQARKTEALQSVGTLIEVPEIYPNLTPREVLTMLAKIRGIPGPDRAHVIEEAVAEVQMGDWIDKKIGKFSKGMKQRICIASALLGGPAVILLDEPTQGLDPRGMNEVRGIIKSLKGQGRLIFMSSHLLGEVTDVCDEVAMINHGKLLDYDTLSNLIAKFSRGENAVEATFRRTVKDEQFADFPNVASVEKIADRIVRIHFTGGLDAQESLLAGIVGMDVGLIDYKLAWSELEDVYLNLIKDAK
jgi:ABC-2 type transport system ATP-binding protein